MTAELLVNVTPSETRVAYIDGGILQEIHIEREARRGIVGNIYKGRVSRVLPGMQAAFVDIGLDKAAFLHASDIMPHTECVAGEEQKQFTVRDISELVRQGQDLMVQVVKDPLGTKGARLTTDITLPSRYLVFMPGASHVGVSQRIESESERERLKKVVAEYCDEQGGFIIRTAAEGVGEAELASDAAYLKRVWTKVMERKKRPQTRYQLYGELALAQRVLRDFADAELDRIRVDSRLTYEALLEFTSEYIPEMTSKLEHYTGRQPIFDLFDVENEIQRALERKVELKSGGYLIIDQTEAMTLGDRIVIMKDGYIQQIGTPEDIYNEPENAFVADFIGESNIIDGVMLDCVISDGEYVGEVLTANNGNISAKVVGMVKGGNLYLAFEVVHGEWSPLSTSWRLNDNVEFKLNGESYTVVFYEGEPTYSSNISYGMSKTEEVDGKYVTTIELCVENVP